MSQPDSLSTQSDAVRALLRGYLIVAATMAPTIALALAVGALHSYVGDGAATALALVVGLGLLSWVAL